MSSDFLHLDSGDSDYFSTPQASRVRDKNPLAGFSPQQKSSLRSELRAVYDKLDTPVRGNLTRQRHSLATGSTDSTLSRDQISSFDISKPKADTSDRMKLSNIIDSETTADDTGDLLFTSTLLETASEKFLVNSTAIQTQVNHKYNYNHNQSDTEVSETEESPFEITRPIRISSPVKHFDNQNYTEPGFGKLLQVDSASDHLATPRSMKDFKSELDNSKTRFRRTIMELVNSSPLSVGDRQETAVDFKELLRKGNALSSRLIEEFETTEQLISRKADNFKDPALTQLSLSKIENEVKASDMAIPSRPMTVEELLRLTPNKNDKKVSITPKVLEAESEGIKPEEKSVVTEYWLGRFFRRLVWAISFLVFFMLLDVLFQTALIYQEFKFAQLDIPSWTRMLEEKCLTLLDEAFSKLGWYQDIKIPL